MIIFQERLVKAMEDKGVKTKDLSTATDLSTDKINKFKNGKSVPDIEELGKMASALGEPMAYLLGETDKVTMYK